MLSFIHSTALHFRKSYKYERFEAHESIAYKENFLKTPVVDKWALELKKLLQQNCSNLNLKKREFTYINTIDIDNAWAYKHKGLFRTIGAIFKDVFKNVRGDISFLNGKSENGKNALGTEKSNSGPN